MKEGRISGGLTALAAYIVLSTPFYVLNLVPEFMLQELTKSAMSFGSIVLGALFGPRFQRFTRLDRNLKEFAKKNREKSEEKNSNRIENLKKTLDK